MALSLPVRVSCRETASHEWSEMSRLVDVTPFGARLQLKRPTETGRLLLLTMVMPRQLRCFDHAEDQYRVWSLVRNLRTLDAATHKGAVIEIGVAFVGKRPPASFLTDPSTRYDIANLQSGMWTVQEESEEQLSEVDPTDKRKEWRHTIPTEVTIEVFGGERESPQFENTVTENISASGAAVFTALNLDRGRFVKLRTREGVEIMAVVRNRIVGADGIARLHLQFIGYEWPL
jgi:PilZ domain